MELEKRPCKHCLRVFKCLTSSKQQFCCSNCDMEYVKNSGNEKRWKEKQLELKKLGHSQLVIGAIIERQSKLPKEMRSGKLATVKDTRVIWNSDKEKSSETTKPRRSEIITIDTKRNLTPNEQPEKREEKPMIQNTENENKNTSFNGIKGIEKLTKNEPKPIAENETPLLGSNQQLMLVKEVISSQMSFIDKSASLIMQRMEQLNRVQTDEKTNEMIRQPSMTDIDQTIQLARVMNDLMRTKKDAIKTIHDMVKG